MRVELTPIPFDVILLSAVEQYNNEVIGLLFGKVHSDQIRIEMAYPLSHAEGNATQVTIDDDRLALLKKLYPKLRTQDRIFLGIYHSHPDLNGEEGSHVMSQHDHAEFLQNNAHIELVTAINPTDQDVEWVENADGTIAGSNINYKFRLAVYHKSEGEVERCTLVF